MRVKLHHRGRVDHARLEQTRRRAVWCEPGHAGRVERHARAVEQRGPGERVAVAAQTGTREADDAVAGAHVARQHLAALDDADREADEIELARLHHAGVLRHLAAEQRAARAPAALGHARDHLLDLFGDELADRDVVEEEQRLGALRRDVVDRHRDAVDPDRVAPVGEPRDQRLRADAVGRRHEQRIAEALPVDGEQAAEPADVADDLGPERRADVRLDELDRLLARGDVDARAGIGQLAVGWAHARSAGAAAEPEIVPCTWIVRDSDSSTCLVSYSGTGTGYSPVKHAVQNDSRGEPVAATRWSRSR